MNDNEKPKGIHTFWTQAFTVEADARAFASTHEGAIVCELKRLFDDQSDWTVLVPK